MKTGDFYFGTSGDFYFGIDTGLPVLNASFFPLGDRPPEEMFEWYRQNNYSLEDPQHFPLEWHPATFDEDKLCDLTLNKAKRPPDNSDL